MGKWRYGPWIGLVWHDEWMEQVLPDPARSPDGGLHVLLLLEGEAVVVLVVSVDCNLFLQGIMATLGGVAAWLTSADPWVSGILQAVQLCILTPKVWKVVLEDLNPGDGSTKDTAGYTALGRLGMHIIKIVNNVTSYRSSGGPARDGLKILFTISKVMFKIVLAIKNLLKSFQCFCVVMTFT